MNTKELQTELQELKKRVEELERRPVYVPYYQPTPPWPGWPQPYIGDPPQYPWNPWVPTCGGAICVSTTGTKA